MEVTALYSICRCAKDEVRRKHRHLCIIPTGFEPVIPDFGRTKSVLFWSKLTEVVKHVSYILKFHCSNLGWCIGYCGLIFPHFLQADNGTMPSSRPRLASSLLLSSSSYSRSGHVVYNTTGGPANRATTQIYTFVM
jgi:hypothetical protein